MLTKRQRQLLIFIHGQLKEKGYSPSYQEMQEHLNLSSKSGIYRHILCLVERGFIRRIPNKARALEVIKLPDSVTLSAPPKGRQEFRPTIVGSNKPDVVTPDHTIPFLGYIAFDSPLSAMAKERYRMKLPDRLDSEIDYFALEINGLWMTEAGIMDDDVLIFRKTESALNGDIVCAYLDNETVAIRRFRQSGRSIALETAEKDKETQIFKNRQIDIQGKLVFLQRTLE